MSAVITNKIYNDIPILLLEGPDTVDNMQVACFVTSHGQ